MTTPVDPARDLARDWARQELSDPVYAQARPGLLERAVLWVLDRLGDMQFASGPFGARTGLVLLLLVVGVAVVVVLLRTGGLRGPSRRLSEGRVFTGQALTAAQHLELAEAAAAAGRWRDAVRERFRALVSGLEERAVVDERPGRTADEAAAEAARVLPQQAQSLRDAATVFDEVCYGQRPATAADDDVVRRAHAQASAARVTPAADMLSDETALLRSSRSLTTP